MAGFFMVRLLGKVLILLVLFAVLVGMIKAFLRGGKDG